MSFNFDLPTDRRGTHSVKFDERAAKFGRADVTPLWVADMDFAAPSCVTQALIERARHPIYGYTVVPESLYQVAIDWHAARHDWRITREHMLIVPGTLPALAMLVEALTDDDTGVVIQPPVYGPFDAVPRALGRRIVANPLIEDDGHYRPDFDQLEHLAAQGARLLLLCNPHNPVGRVWTPDELEAVLAIARRHDMLVFADEVHGDLAYRDARHTPLGRLARPGDRIISAVSPSKPFNVQGLALTLLVIPDSGLRHAVAQAIEAHHLGNMNPFALAAAEAAWRDGGPWLDALVTYLEDTRDQVDQYASARLAPLRLVAPQASYLAWLDCRGLGLDAAALSRFFVDTCHLGLNPGTDFGAAGVGFMRLNIGSPRARIMAALDAIGAELAAL